MPDGPLGVQHSDHIATLTRHAATPFSTAAAPVAVAFEVTYATIAFA